SGVGTGGGSGAGMTGDSGVAEVVDRASRFAFLLAAVVVAMVWLVVAARADRAFLPGGLRGRARKFRIGAREVRAGAAGRRPVIAVGACAAWSIATRARA